MIPLLNTHARLAICGQISQYNLEKPEMGPRPFWPLIVKQARAEGFLVFQFADRFPAAAVEMAGWIKAGKLKYKEDIIEGFENLPRAFIGMLGGGQHRQAAGESGRQLDGQSRLQRRSGGRAPIHDRVPLGAGVELGGRVLVAQDHELIAGGQHHVGLWARRSEPSWPADRHDHEAAGSANFDVAHRPTDQRRVLRQLDLVQLQADPHQLFRQRHPCPWFPSAGLRPRAG